MKFRSHFFVFIFSISFTVQAQTSDSAMNEPQKVACVGDSITVGVGAHGANESYPTQLGKMLGSGWLVQGFGASGHTLLNEGDHPYQKNPVFAKALKFNPNFVIIMLGTNDTKPQNWKFKSQFVADYKDLIGKFKALPSAPKIYICRPVVVPGKGNFGITEEILKEEIPLIDQIAQEESVELIDMHQTLLGHEDLIPDHVHPNGAGYTLMARTAYKALTGKVYSDSVPGN